MLAFFSSLPVLDRRFGASGAASRHASSIQQISASLEFSIFDLGIFEVSWIFHANSKLLSDGFE